MSMNLIYPHLFFHRRSLPDDRAAMLTALFSSRATDPPPTRRAFSVRHTLAVWRFHICSAGCEYTVPASIRHPWRRSKHRTSGHRQNLILIHASGLVDVLQDRHVETFGHSDASGLGHEALVPCLLAREDPHAAWHARRAVPREPARVHDMPRVWDVARARQYYHFEILARAGGRGDCRGWNALQRREIVVKWAACSRWIHDQGNARGFVVEQHVVVRASVAFAFSHGNRAEGDSELRLGDLVLDGADVVKPSRHPARTKTRAP